MSDTHLITPEELRNLRKRFRLTQKELAKKAGVSQSLIARIENKSVDPRLSTVRRIFNAITSIQRERKKAKDVMHSPVITIEAMDTIKNAISLMKKFAISQLPVLRENKIVGSIQESALLDKLVNSKDADRFFSSSVYNIMEKSFPVVEPEADVNYIVNVLARENSALLVIENNKIVGIITKIDLLLPSTHSNEK
ncbi:MAG: CBS domain-containing protein [Candidatus Kariarchaeaceae archaeon]|jgi:predicted transcriptional regulator